MPHSHSDDALTLARLVQEPVLRRARIHSGRAGAVTRIEWVVPWAVVARTEEPLGGQLVHACAHELTEEGTTLAAAAERMAGRGAAALLVTEHDIGPEDAAAATRLPMATTPDDVPFALVNRLVADLTLARETHVLRYGLSVHRVLAELLYRGADLAALCSQMARMSQRPVAVFDTQGTLAALDQPQTAGRGAGRSRPRVRRSGRDARYAGRASRSFTPASGRSPSADGALTCVLTPIVLGAGTTVGCCCSRTATIRIPTTWPSTACSWSRRPRSSVPRCSDEERPAGQGAGARRFPARPAARSLRHRRGHRRPCRALRVPRARVVRRGRRRRAHDPGGRGHPRQTSDARRAGGKAAARAGPAHPGGDGR